MSSAVIGPGHVVAGRYRIECLLGQGAMGSVYRAVQLSIERHVALKLLALESGENPGLSERFEREALALSRLSHPNTVRLFDYGSDERGAPFIVMELLRGSDLAEDLERQGPLRWDQALRVLQAVAGSLAEAHQAGIVHRDIKPANVFLCAGVPWPAIKVLDFGIAGETNPERTSKLTRTGTVVGSAAYMSPEQAQGHAVGPPSDLYALGVLAFEALTTRTPFDARAFTAQLLAKVLEPAPALREVCPTLDVPEGVEELIRDLLDRDAARRPDSAALIARCDGLLARCTLAPLEREVLTARSLSTAPGVAMTQPMRVARTMDDGWSPPRTGSAPGVRIEVAKRPLRRVLGPAALVAGLAGGLTWTLASRTSAPDPVRAEAPLAPARATSAESAPSEQAAEAPVVEGPPPMMPAEPSPAPAPPATAPSASPAADKTERPGAERSGADRSAAERAAAEPPTRVPASARYPNEAAVRRAEAAGEITSLERNRLINRLHEQKAKDLRRARRAYHDGQITRQELDDKEAAIEREFEGP